MPKIKRKEALSEPFVVYKDRSGRITKVVFPHTVEFGVTGSSDFQGEVRFKNVDPLGQSGSRITPGGSVTTAAINSALGFTPGNPANSARTDLSNVTASTGRSALGINSHATGSLSDIFSNLTTSNVTTGLGFTPANTSLSNVTASTGRSALGISDHVTGSLSSIFSNLNSSQVGTALGFTPANVANTVKTDLSNAPSTILNSNVTKSSLGIANVENKSSATIRGEIDSSDVTGGLGFTPANVNFSNVTASTGRSALGVSDHVTGSLSDVFDNLTTARVTTGLGFTPANVNFSNVTASTGRSALGVSDHVTGSLADVFNNLTTARVTTGLGFTPANVNFSNVTASTGRSALGVSDHVTGSLSDVFDNLTTARVTNGLGFTPANVNFSNVTASTGRSALGVSDHVTGSLADVFDNLTTARVTAGLGFTPINVTLANAPSTILNSNVTKSSVGLGNVENKSSATIRGEIDSSDVSGGLGFTPANVTGANFSSTALSNIITSGKGANGYSIDYEEVGGFDSGDNSYLLKVGASGVVGQRNINISTIQNSTSTTVITGNTTGYALTVENDSNSSVNSPDGIAITMDNALEFIVNSMKKSKGSDTFVPKLKAYNIMDLKDALFEILGKTDYKITKIRPGEKLAEVLIGMDEMRNTLESNSDYVITQGTDSLEVLKEKYPNYNNVKDLKRFSSNDAEKVSKKELIKMLESTINSE